jgi:hypothetical protein
MDLKEIPRDNVGWIDLSEEGQIAGCCERGNESMCFTDCMDIYIYRIRSRNFRPRVFCEP